MEFLGFCIVVAAFIVCDTWIFLRGYNSFLHEAKTNEEKQLHAAIIKRETSAQQQIND